MTLGQIGNKELSRKANQKVRIDLKVSYSAFQVSARKLWQLPIAPQS